MGIFMFLDQSCAKTRLNSRESKSTSHESKVDQSREYVDQSRK